MRNLPDYSADASGLYDIVEAGTTTTITGTASNAITATPGSRGSLDQDRLDRV